MLCPTAFLRLPLLTVAGAAVEVSAATAVVVAPVVVGAAAALQAAVDFVHGHVLRHALVSPPPLASLLQLHSSSSEQKWP